MISAEAPKDKSAEEGSNINKKEATSDSEVKHKLLSQKQKLDFSDIP